MNTDRPAPGVAPPAPACDPQTPHYAAAGRP
jgi:hypothetical protein